MEVIKMKLEEQGILLGHSKVEDEKDYYLKYDITDYSHVMVYGEQGQKYVIERLFQHITYPTNVNKMDLFYLNAYGDDNLGEIKSSENVTKIIAKDISQVISGIERLLLDQKERTKLMVNSGVRNVEDFNRKAIEQGEGDTLPVKYIIFDDFRPTVEDDELIYMLDLLLKTSRTFGYQIIFTGKLNKHLPTWLKEFFRTALYFDLTNDSWNMKYNIGHEYFKEKLDQDHFNDSNTFMKVYLETNSGTVSFYNKLYTI